MESFKAGDTIEHTLMPGFPMQVQDTKACEIDSARPEPHLQYKITDPEGTEDWLCAYDVQLPG
jgi:hypothetical protein